jgi:hypothetical protein
VRHGQAQLRREEEVEAPRSRVAVHRRDQRLAEVEAREERRRDAAQALHLLVAHALAARELLGGRDRGPHVHAGAEHAVAGPGQHRAADLLVAHDAPPGGGEVAQGRRVEGVRPLGPIQRDERDVRVGLGELEPCGHGRQRSSPSQAPEPGEADGAASAPGALR